MEVAGVPEPRQPIAAGRVALAEERERERVLRPEEPPDGGAPGAHGRGHARERHQPQPHVPGQRLRRRVGDGRARRHQLRRTPAGGGETDGRPATGRAEPPAGDGDDRHVDERQRDVGARAAVEREDHAPRGDQEADAEPAGEGRQARRAGVDGRARARAGSRRGPAAAEPAKPAQAGREALDPIPAELLRHRHRSPEARASGGHVARGAPRGPCSRRGPGTAGRPRRRGRPARPPAPSSATRRDWAGRTSPRGPAPWRPGPAPRPRGTAACPTSRRGSARPRPGEPPGWACCRARSATPSSRDRASPARERPPAARRARPAPPAPRPRARTGRGAAPPGPTCSTRQ